MPIPHNTFKVYNYPTSDDIKFCCLWTWSLDNLCNQFGPWSGPTMLCMTWLLPVNLVTDSIPKRWHMCRGVEIVKFSTCPGTSKWP